MFSNMSTFTPLVNGVGGNLVAVHASRLSTFLHRQAEKNALRKKTSDHPLTLTPSARIQYSNLSLGTLKVLLALLPPAHFIFFTVIGLMKSYSDHDSPVPPQFFLFVFLASLTQVSEQHYSCYLCAWQETSCCVSITCVYVCEWALTMSILASFVHVARDCRQASTGTTCHETVLPAPLAGV